MKRKSSDCLRLRYIAPMFGIFHEIPFPSTERFFFLMAAILVGVRSGAVTFPFLLDFLFPSAKSVCTCEEELLLLLIPVEIGFPDMPTALVRANY